MSWPSRSAAAKGSVARLRIRSCPRAHKLFLMRHWYRAKVSAAGVGVGESLHVCVQLPGRLLPPSGHERQNESCARRITWCKCSEQPVRPPAKPAGAMRACSGKRSLELNRSIRAAFNRCSIGARSVLACHVRSGMPSFESEMLGCSLQCQCNAIQHDTRKRYNWPGIQAESHFAFGAKRSTTPSPPFEAFIHKYCRGPLSLPTHYSGPSVFR